MSYVQANHAKDQELLAEEPLHPTVYTFHFEAGSRAERGALWF